jgi:hypothetical protein
MQKDSRGKTLIVLAALALLAAVVIPAIAGSVYGRASGSIAQGSTTAVWTNNSDYAALALKRIWIEDNKSASATVTVTRVTSDSLYTQAVGSVVCSSGDGSTATLTASYLQDGDMLRFVNSKGSNAVYIVEYEFQQH